MAKFIIVVDFIESDVELSKLVFNFLKTKGNCLQLTVHSFMLSADTDPVELRDAIKIVDERIKRIFVSQMIPPAAWGNSSR